MNDRYGGNDCYGGDNGGDSDRSGGGDRSGRGGDRHGGASGPPAQSRYDGGRGASQAPAQAAFEETSFVPQLTRIGAQQSSRGASQPQSRGGSFTQQQQQRRGLLSISQQLQQPVAKAGFSFTHPSNTAQQAPPAPHFSHLSSQTRYPPQQPPYQQPPYQQYQQYQQPPLEPYGGGASTAAAQNPASIQKLREAMMETLMRRK